MKYYKNILNYLILVMIFITSSLGQDLEEGDITITLTLLNTGWFTYYTWEDEDISLWSVNIENNTSVDQQYRIYSKQ